MNLLNNLGRFTDVIDESTRSLGQSINVQHTLSNVDIIDQTRCARDNTLHLTANNKVTTGVSNFKDLRLNLPTFILGYNTEGTSKFIGLTLEEFFTFQEARSLNDCFCFTTEHLGEQHLTTITLSQEGNKVTRLSVNSGQRKAKLVCFQTIYITSNSIVSLSRRQTGQTNAAGLRQYTNFTTDIISTELNLSTSGNTMREVELQIVQVKVHNIGELRFQSHNWL